MPPSISIRAECHPPSLSLSIRIRAHPILPISLSLSLSLSLRIRAHPILPPLSLFGSELTPRVPEPPQPRHSLNPRSIQMGSGPLLVGKKGGAGFNLRRSYRRDLVQFVPWLRWQ
ncbi:hypothetical protein IE53DRAFT_388750 [Violaceomyces palustris]|uniref:Uncharacterized protein n=1 Tax=Violaceomyces palustris TaxID=1673888 RepID=A0ACD0NT76_9BASI|nr:hypothetical protein IE53DRAFT_388750 [Violaceomyces palustris]